MIDALNIDVQDHSIQTVEVRVPGYDIALVEVRQGPSGPAGAAGATGATGATGPAGPNNITTATTTDLTGFLSGNGTTVTASTNATFNNGSTASFSGGSQANFNINSAAVFDNSQASFNSGSQASFDDGSEAYFGSDSQAVFANGTIKLQGTTTQSSLNFVDPTSAKTITLPDATGTVALTNDPRFTDARTPLAHTHVVGDIISIASQHLIGRHAGGTGAGQAVDVGNGLEFQGSGIRRSALTGDITAAAGSNATTLAATIAGNKTFSGTMALSSTLTVGGQTQLAATQAATDANSAMTRGLGDARYGGPIFDLDASASHSESAATTPIKTVVLPVGTYLIEFGKLALTHTDAAVRNMTCRIDFSGGVAAIFDRHMGATPNQSTTTNLNFLNSSTFLTTGVNITNLTPAFGSGSFSIGGRIVVTSQTTFRIFGFCSVTPTNPISYETSGILRQIA